MPRLPVGTRLLLDAEQIAKFWDGYVFYGLIWNGTEYEKRQVKIVGSTADKLDVMVVDGA